MSGSEQSLNVILGQEKIAEINLHNDQLHWEYTDDWIEKGYAVSPHIPLASSTSPVVIQRFLRNLLPEGLALDELVVCFHLSKNNTYGLIRALGLDTSGSLVFLSNEQSLPVDSQFRIIPEEELAQRLDVKKDFSILIWDGKPRLSVAGVQDKINVTINAQGQLGFGEGALCSTHILKFEKKKLKHLVLNEYLTMQLAKQCGLEVADVQLRYFGANPALLIKRFDRQISSDNRIKRRHMIDGCQSLNLPPEYKYERNFGSGRDVAHIRDGASYPKLFKFAEQCANPAMTKKCLIDWVIFNLLVFNCDAHGKNISFFVGSQGIRLTPFYDLVNVQMYSEFEQELAMAIGDEFDVNCIHAYQLADFSDACNVPRALVASRLLYLAKKLSQAIGEFVFEDGLIRDKEQEKYIIAYKTMIETRCEYLLIQAKDIVSINL